VTEPAWPIPTIFYRRAGAGATPSGRPDVASSVRTLAIESPPPALRPADASTPAAPWIGVGVREASEPSHPPSTLFDELPDAVLRFDWRLVVVYLNPAVERGHRDTQKAFLGRPLNQVEHFTHMRPLWEAKLAATFDSLEARSFKFTYAHPAGAKSFEVRLGARVRCAAPARPT